MSSSTQTPTATRKLLAFSILSRAVYVLLLLIAGYLPQFDVSHRILLSGGTGSKLIDALLRWDAFHFAHIAKDGYVYEHQWAFLPGTPFMMRLSSYVISFLGIDTSNIWEVVLAGGALTAITCDTTISLYKLSLHHLRCPRMAYLAALVSLVPSSPAVLRFAPYGEPFVAFFSYRGWRWFTIYNLCHAF
jgi:GPI mannosyltransferase 2